MLLILDESDYMTDADFDSVSAIAGERENIRMIMSSTPTGRRGHFYFSCIDKRRGFNEHYHPSTHNPNWTPKMEAEFRATLSEQGYSHEIMAEFGTQDMGVFNKDKLDAALKFKYYAYNELDYYQQQRAKYEEEENRIRVEMFDYNKQKPAPMNPLRCAGIDWDKFGSSSSIIIMDYIPEERKFMVIKRIEVPKAEYHYDAAVNLIIEINEIYNPSWIYCDAGAGEYQIERLHIYGDEHPETGLRHKVIRRNFKQSLDIQDPVTHEIEKKPLKLFMVNQLQVAFERDLIMLSPFDELLHKQLIDYEVVKFSGTTHDPVFTSKNEHFVDALGLAYLAFVIEFNELIDMVRDTTVKAVMQSSKTSFAKKSINDLYRRANQNQDQVWYNKNGALPLSDPFKDEGFTETLIAMPIKKPGLKPSPRSGYNNPYSSKRGQSNRTRSSW